MEQEGMLTDAGDDDAYGLAVGGECTLHSADIAHVAFRHTELGGDGRLGDTIGEEEFGQFRWSACHC